MGKDETHTIELARLGDLNDAATRASLLRIHPMLNQEYWVNTPEGEGLYQVLYSYVLRRKSGLYAIGRNRVGKTDALDEAARRLRNDFPYVPVFVVTGERIERDTKRNFTRLLLRETGFAMDELKVRSSPEDVFVRFMASECLQRGGKHVLLLIDEAQLLSVADYRTLLEFWNTLKKEGFLLCTALLGQESLKQLRLLTSELDHRAVVARFFVKLYVFRGVRSVTVLREILRSYDTDLIYPRGSEWPYSRYFAMRKFDAGWRLESEAEMFWQALVKVSRPHKKETAIPEEGFVMGWVVDAIHGFLTEAMTLDHKAWKSGVAMWERHIRFGSVEEML